MGFDTIEINLVFLNCWSTKDISFWERNRLPKPFIRTGVPYKDMTLRDATGLALFPLARPQDDIAPKAFLKDVNLSKVFGILPSADLMTPTCSASVAKLMVVPSILMGL